MLSGGKAASELHIKCGCTETWPQSNYARKQEEPFRLIWLFRPASLGSLRGMPRRTAVWVGSGVSTAPCPPESRGGRRLTACLRGQSAGKRGSPGREAMGLWTGFSAQPGRSVPYPSPCKYLPSTELRSTQPDGAGGPRGAGRAGSASGWAPRAQAGGWLGE